MHIQKSLTLGMTPSLPKIQTIDKRQKTMSRNRKSQDIADINYFLSSKNSRVPSEPDETSKFWEALKSISTKAEQKKKEDQKASVQNQHRLLLSRGMNSPKLPNPLQIERKQYLENKNLNKELSNSALLYQAYYGSTKRNDEGNNKNQEIEHKQIIHQYLKSFKFQRDVELCVDNKSLSQLPGQRTNTEESNSRSPERKKDKNRDSSHESKPNRQNYYVSQNQARRKLYSIPISNENPSFIIDKKTGIILYQPDAEVRTGGGMQQDSQHSKSKTKLTLPPERNLTEERMKTSFYDSKIFTKTKEDEGKSAVMSHKHIDGSLFNSFESLVSPGGPNTRNNFRTTTNKFKTPKPIKEKLKIETSIAIKEKLQDASFNKYLQGAESCTGTKRSFFETIPSETSLKIPKYDHQTKRDTNRVSAHRSPKNPAFHVKINEPHPTTISSPIQILINKEEQPMSLENLMRNPSKSNIQTSIATTTASLKASLLTNQTSPSSNQFYSTFHFSNTPTQPEKAPKKVIKKNKHTMSSLNLEETTRNLLEKKLADQFEKNEGSLEGWTLNTSHSYISANSDASRIYHK